MNCVLFLFMTQKQQICKSDNCGGLLLKNPLAKNIVTSRPVVSLATVFDSHLPSLLMTLAYLKELGTA
jgi:hypothetical protein